MDNLVSIIVPIYKVEEYLIKCIDSLVNQTYKDLEIILVDDGSPDSCGDICDEAAKHDNRIKVVHKKNGGLSDARNAGMQIATGKYISFIDSDDFISLDFYQTLLDVIKRTDCDIVECGVLKVNPDFEDKHDISKITSEKTYSAKDALVELINDGEFHQHVWNKLYKREVVENILFEKGACNEDEFWTYRVFGNAKKIVKVDTKMYFYLQRPGSIMGVGYSLKRLDALKAKKERQIYLEKNYSDIAHIGKINFFLSCYYAYKASTKWLKGNDKKTAKKTIKTHLKNITMSKKDTSILNKKNRIRCRLIQNPVTLELLSRFECLMKIGL